MPSRKQKKRKRKEHTRCADSLASIRRFLPPNQAILYLDDFVKQYAPSLQLCTSSEMDNGIKSTLQQMLVAPMESLTPSLHVKSAVCQEPVPSLVDDVVWSLVQRRDRWSRLPDKDGRNVLARGYSTSPPQNYRPATAKAFPSIRPGLMQWQANDNVSFCKTSRVFQHLHRYVGDEVLRKILLHTRLFVPLEVSPGGTSRGNFTLVCGPPLTTGPVSRIQLTDKTMNSQHKLEVSKGRPVKRRKRHHPERPSHLEVNQSISRYNMFYSDSFTPSIGLHHKHPFCDPSMTPERLLASMTDLYTACGARRRKRWRRIRGAGIAICQSILSSAKQCDYGRILGRWCPLPDSMPVPNAGIHNSTETLNFLVQSYCPHDGVVSFLRSTLCEVFRLEFWGSQRNLDCMMETVKTFVNLRRKERLSNKRLLYGIRTNDILWLHGKKEATVKLARSDHEATCKLVLQVFRWLFRGFIMPLLRSVFYATETEFSSKQVLYYRKPVWSAFRSLSLAKLLKEQFRELSRQDVLSCLSTHKMGFSRLRLLPKKTGVRPIAQLSRLLPVRMEDVLRAPKRTTLDSSIGYNTVSSLSGGRRDSTNAMLVSVFDVLTYEADRREDPFGSGLKGLTDFYPRYHKYIGRMKRELGEGQALNLIFASVDVEKCYDNINQKFMCDIAERQIAHDDYIIQKYNLLYGDEVTGGVRRVIKKRVGPPESHNLLHQRTRNSGNVVSGEFSNAVLDSRIFEMFPRYELVGLLREHLNGHLVATSGRFGQRFLLQTGGISQGSILSMLLCNLYYGEMEKLLLYKENPQSPGSVKSLGSVDKDFLARQVDDFIFVSRSTSTVLNFVKRMWVGHEELGVRINRDKTLVSQALTFCVDGSDLPIKPPVAPSLFPWCGMLFDTHTAEVYIDYERFHNGKTKESLTVDFDGSEGRKLEVRMESYVRPRCVPILFDPLINSRSVIIINFYQLMLFAAAKTVEHIRSTDACPSIKHNENFVLRCIDSLASYAGRQIRCNLRHQAPDQSLLILDDRDLCWLTWHAFARVFSHLDSVGSLNSKILGMSHNRSCPSRWNSLSTDRTLDKAFEHFSLEKIIKL